MKMIHLISQVKMMLTKLFHLSKAAHVQEPPGIAWCFSLRHGGKPIARTSKARGTSAGGKVFEVFECPQCGRFAALTFDPKTGRRAILFSGKHYEAREQSPYSLNAGHAS